MSVATGRSVSVNLRANVTPYIAAIRQATIATTQLQTALGATARSSTQLQTATARASTATATAATAASTAARAAATSAAATNRTLGTIGTRTAAVGAGMLLAIGVAAVAFAKFEKQMSAVKAVSNATSAEMDALSQAAIDMGAATAFSASDAARAEGELAKAGISVDDILSGALQGSLALAAAGQLDLARSAEIAGQAMNIFSLGGEDVGRIADALANGANKSAADVDSLAQALAQGGGVAATTGLTLEDTVGTLAAFADNALVGSDAGTSLKTMLQRLNPTSKEAKDKMAELGIAAYDAQGNFIGIEALAGQLQTTMQGLTQEEHDAAFATIFGSDAVRAANVLYKEGATGIREYVDATGEVGTAALVAATQMDNLSGDLETLKGAFETGLIQAGSESNDILREMVQNLTEVVQWFNALPAPIQAGLTQFLLVAGVVTLIGGGLLILTTRAIAARVAFVNLTTASPRLATALSNVGKAAGIITVLYAVATAIAAITDASKKPIPGLEATTQALLDMSEAGDTAALDTLFRSLDDGEHGVDDFGAALDRVTDKNFLQWVEDTGDGFFNVNGDFKQTSDLLDNVGQSLAGLVTSGNADVAAAQFELLAEQAEAQGISVEELLDLMPPYRDALTAQENAQDQAIASGEGMSAQMEAVQQSTEDAAAALDDFSQALDDIFDQAFSLEEAQDALVGKFNDLTGGIQANKDALKAAKEAGDDAAVAAQGNALSLDANTLSGLANREALRTLAEGHADVLQAMADTGATTADLTAKALTLKEEFYKQAEAAGFTREQVATYATVFDEIPTAVSTLVTANTSAAEAALGRVVSTVTTLDGKQVIITITTRHDDIAVGTAGRNTRTRGPAMQAAGGYITGPGTSTSDSIPALLSNKEYVVKAAAVARYGVRFFDEVNSMRFASGGLVSPTIVRVPVTETHSNEAPINIGTVIAADVGDFERQADRRRRLQGSRGWTR